MKRLAFVLITGILLVGLSGAVRADAGFWAGAKGVYFHPLNSYLNEWYRPFWGVGTEGGWVVKKHFDFGVGVSYVRARGKMEMQQTDVSGNIIGTVHDEASQLMISSRVAYRILERRTPYFGLAVGWFRPTWRLVGVKGLEGHDLGEAKSAIGTELFMGYDWRLNRLIGLRAEGSIQVAKAKDFPGEGDMGGQKASLGAYMAW